MSDIDLKMEDVEWAGDKDYQLVTFSWDIIDVCQYNCTYCCSMHFNQHNFSDNDRNAWKGVVSRLSLKSINMPFRVEILGGEPTLHPDLPLVVEKLCNIKNCTKIELITNLAKPQKYYEQFSISKYDKMYISASYHPEYYTDKFITKVIELNKLRTDTFVTPMFNLSDKEEHWDQIFELVDKCISEEVPYSLNLLHDVEERDGKSWTSNYTEKFWARFDEIFKRDMPYKSIPDEKDNFFITSRNIKYGAHGKTYTLSEDEIVRHKLNRFKGWKCRPQMYYINMNGQISNACTAEPVPAFIKKQDLLEERTCPLDCCQCDLKYYYPKERV